MFTEGTPFDLRMHIVRIPVRVIPTFWLVAAYLGWDPDRLDLVGVWILCMFFSILIHELGHALTAEAFGYESDITLWHFGGFARFNPGYHYPPYQQFLITLAGPFAGFALAALTFVAWIGLELQDLTANEIVMSAIWDLLYINIAWGLLNLLPVIPLDGGRLLEATLGIVGVRTATDWALKVSLVVGGLCAYGFFQIGQPGMGIMMALMALESFQQMQARRW
jgi:stage IV sporulation protein FB